MREDRDLQRVEPYAHDVMKALRLSLEKHGQKHISHENSPHSHDENSLETL